MKKRIISLFLAVLMTVSIMPIGGATSASAATNSKGKLSAFPNYGDVGGSATRVPTNSNGIQVRLNQIVDELKTKFPNGVFTADGQRCYDETNYCDCSLYGIVNAKYPSLSSTIVSKSSNGWDCAAFAKLITVLMFGTCKDTKDTLSLGSAHSASSYNSLRMGDLIYTGHPHWMIYISHTDTTVTVLDANGYGDQKIGYYRTYNLSNGNFDGQLSTWQSPHWDEVNSKYAPTVSSISVQSKPSKTVYTVGETFNLSGLSIKVNMSDGTSKTVTSGFTVSSPDLKTAGTKTVTVTYEGKTTTFTITVNNPPATVSSISVNAMPSKTVYTVGETFSSSGLSIKVNMSDGTSKTITSGFTVSSPNMSTAGTKTVTVTYEGKTTTFTITVNNPPATVSSIAVQSKPTKTVYTVGETFSSSGLSIKVNMSDGTSKTVTSGFTVSSPDMKTAGTKTVTVTYQGKTTTFTITVNSASTIYGTLTIGSVNAVYGQQISIPVTVSKASLGSLTIDMNYDNTKLRLISIDNVIFSSYEPNTATAGKIRIAATGLKSVSEGAIMVLNFEVIATSSCSTSITANIDEAYDEKDNPVSLNTYAGVINISKVKPGDVNGDGKISILDAKAVLQAVAGTKTLTDTQKKAADLNGDGKVAILDAKWILQIVAGTRDGETLN